MPTMIRLIRVAKNLRLYQVAQKTGISMAKLSYIERGLLPCSREDYARLARVLEMPEPKTDEGK